MKAKTGSLRPQQIEWIGKERGRGGIVLVVDDPNEFIAWYVANFGDEGQIELR
jgi:hypothetical protein